MRAVRFVVGLFLFVASIAGASVAQVQRTFASGLGNDGNLCSRTAVCRTFGQAISDTAPPGSPVLFKSTDAGATWNRSDFGIAASPVHKVQVITVDPLSPSTLCAGTNYGIFKSTDRGDTWTPSSHKAAQLDTREIAVDPLSPPTIYSISTDSFPYAPVPVLPHDVFRSNDGGESWQPVRSLGDAHVSIVIDPSNPRTMYVSGHQPDNIDIDGSFKSTDAGNTWQFGGVPGQLTFDPKNTSIMYAPANDRGRSGIL